MKSISLSTKSRTAFADITAAARQYVETTGIREGVLTVFVPHTTAGVTINENADPDVLADLRQVFDALVPWEGGYRHTEGNTAAHAKASLVGSSVQVPVHQGRLVLGTWQGIFLCEFDGPRTRNVLLQATGA